jgi:hypothetical protein
MPNIPQLLDSIDSRLADIAAEVVTLNAAKAELAAPRQAPATTTGATATRSRRRAARRNVTPSPEPPKRTTRRRTRQPEADVTSTPTPKRATRVRATTARRPRSGGGVVDRGTLERVLADTPAGLSANALAKQAGARYGRTLKLLRELEAAGQVRRSGARRSTVWRMITDEDRIAERAAELERLQNTPSQRRGRARAS